MNFSELKPELKPGALYKTTEKLLCIHPNCIIPKDEIVMFIKTAHDAQDRWGEFRPCLHFLYKDYIVGCIVWGLKGLDAYDHLEKISK